jgi:hypothetical protein
LARSQKSLHMSTPIPVIPNFSAQSAKGSAQPQPKSITRLPFFNLSSLPSWMIFSAVVGSSISM